MKTIVRMDPVTDLQTFGKLFDQFFGISQEAASRGHLIPIDLVENEREFVLTASVPGVSPEDLTLEISDGILSIRGEYRSESLQDSTKMYRREILAGTFARSIRLPENVNTESAEANHNHGILTVRLPKFEEQKPKVLQVPINGRLRAIEGESAAEHQS